MALSIRKCKITSTRGSDVRQLIIEFNALLTVLRAVFVIYDADSGISATTATAALDAGPQQIGNAAGTAIST